MKPDASTLPAEPFGRRGGGWRIVVDELLVGTHVGLHPHEHGAPQPVVIDASLHYRGVPSEASAQRHSDDPAELIDYDGWCTVVQDFLATKPHTRLLEMLAVEIAALSFERWPALDALTIFLYKPKIRANTRRLGVELDWLRADYMAWRARQETAGKGRIDAVAAAVRADAVRVDTPSDVHAHSDAPAIAL